jgi:hypothetical protein
MDEHPRNTAVQVRGGVSEFQISVKLKRHPPDRLFIDFIVNNKKENSY